MLKDEEFLIGGIFTKEEYYMQKYKLTEEEMVNIETCLYYALHINDSEFCERVTKSYY